MSKKNHIVPPTKFTQFFEWFCKPEFFEELQGDLEERFYDNVDKWGIKKAKNIYRKEVLLMFRLSVIKKIPIPYPTNYTVMYKNYALVAFRNIVRNKLFASVNIFSLAVSMAIGLLTIE